MSKLYHDALKADRAWHCELEAAFGKRAGDVRYSRRGEGEPGTALNDACLAYRKTNDAWLESMNSPRP